MTKKNPYLIILLWLEVIICLLGLLFVLPVWVNGSTNRSFIVATLDGRFMQVITIASIYFFLVGFFWLTGFKFGKMFHYLGFVLVLFMTVAYMTLAKRVTGGFDLLHILPLILATTMVIGITLIKVK